MTWQSRKKTLSSDIPIFEDYEPKLRSREDIQIDLQAHRETLEALSGAPIEDDVWAIYRSGKEASFSVICALDIAPLEAGSLSAEHWRKMPSWKLNEAALLLTGIDPRRLDTWLKHTPERQRVFSVPEYLDEVTKVLDAAHMVGELRFPEVPKKVVKWWARDTGRAIPAALKNWGQSRKSSNQDKEDVSEIAVRVYVPGQSLKELLQHPELAPYAEKYQDPKTLRSWVKEAGIQLPKAGRPSKKTTV